MPHISDVSTCCLQACPFFVLFLYHDKHGSSVLSKAHYLPTTSRSGPDYIHNMTSSGEVRAGTHQVALHAGTVECHLLRFVLGKKADPGIDESAADVVVTEAGSHEQWCHQLLVFGLSMNQASYITLMNGEVWAT